MATGVLLAVLFAAVMHACYHAIIKLGDDKVAALGLIAAFETVVGAAGSLVFAPPPMAAWFWLLAAVALQTGYRFLVCHAYRLGDLSQVMPIARGSAPILVTLGSALWLGEHLSRAHFAAILLIAAGIMTLAVVPNAQGRVDGRAAAVAMVSGLMVAAYSMIDGIGVRLTGSSGSYVWWLTMVGGAAFLAPSLALRRRHVGELLRRRWYVGLLGATFSTATYWTVVWAMTVAPIGMVSALRETSVLFAVLIGVLFLGERPGATRLAAIALAAMGIAMLRIFA